MDFRSTGVLLACSIILVSCSGDETKTAETNNTGSLCANEFVINGGSGKTLNLKAKVISENTRNVVSNSAGNVEFLDCEKGKRVTAKTLIAKIKPDQGDPSTQNLVNQANMIAAQISNTKGIVSSTVSNFETQLNSLSVQKNNLETQLGIANDSYSKIGEQKDFGVLDIEEQLDSLSIQMSTLDTQITDLSASKAKLEESKTADLAKLRSNFANTKTQSKSLAGNVLLQIDEIFGITDENRARNDEFETYLSAKNSALKTKVEQDWKRLEEKRKSFDSIPDSALPDYLQSLSDLASLAKESIKSSAPSSSFPQSTVDTLHATFTQYESSIITAKNGLDNVVKSLDTVANTYDTQILSVNTQINAAENNKKNLASSIANLKSNKLGTYTTSIELSKNQTKSQIETLKGNLSTITSQIESLKSQKAIQLNQLENQLAQLESSMNTANINLAEREIYAEVDGIVKEKGASAGNKVGSSAMLCQILPDESSLKFQVYSSVDIPVPSDVTTVVDGKTYVAKIVSKLPYQDSTTQNYVYETSGSLWFEGNETAMSKILSEGKTADVSIVSSAQDTKDGIFVPINYVSNTISGSKVKVKSANGTPVEKTVVLGELDANDVKIRSGLEKGETICN